mmetsp:Transcript_4142/g.15364  ORF Transcript_4142/g.15364 Transcript_4142/m.15364 type:complete len:276 (-) Transcript_4142:247-1074(-)
MAGLNPMSSNLSASSNTRVSHERRRWLTSPFSRWSMSRPGVPTRMSHRSDLRRETSVRMLVPPNTTCALMSLLNVSSCLHSSWICVASSRVGESTNAEMPPLRSGGVRFSFSSTGRRKAMVFPEPVLARARTSLPAMMWGSTASCTSVAWRYPLTSWSARSDSSHRSRSAKATVVGALPADVRLFLTLGSLATLGLLATLGADDVDIGRRSEGGAVLSSGRPRRGLTRVPVPPRPPRPPRPPPSPRAPAALAMTKDGRAQRCACGIAPNSLTAAT